MLRKSGCYILKYKKNAETNILYMISKTIWEVIFQSKIGEKYNDQNEIIKIPSHTLAVHLVSG